MKTSAITFQFEASDNLAGIYKELGDLNKTRELLEYSYQQKQQHLTKSDPGIFTSQILLANYIMPPENMTRHCHM